MLEREVKLAAAPGFHLPDLSGVTEGVVAAPAEELRLETVYWDTPELNLSRWGCSLRHRRGEGWTLKLPTEGDTGPGLARQELTYSGPSDRPPADALRTVVAFVRGAQLNPVARLSTMRHRVRLEAGGGAKLAEVVDDEVSVLQGRRVAARFRELEVELTPLADAEFVSAVLACLKDAGAGDPDPVAKHVRALGPRAVAPPEVAPMRLSASASAGELFRNAVAISLSALLKHDPAVRMGGTPEDVHQARVATRRLRSHLRLFEPVLVPEWSEPLREELKWLAGALGEVRDQEVLLDRLRSHLEELAEDDRPHLGRLTARLGDQIRASRCRLQEGMGSERYVKLLDRLVEGYRNPALLPEAARPASEIVPPLAAAAFRKLKSAAERIRDDSPDEDLHALRIRAKRSRYAAEAAEPVAGKPAAAFARAAAELQTVLGNHQDSTVAQQWLRSAGSRGRQAFVAGELAAIERLAGRRTREEWPQVWKKLKKGGLRSWMG